MAEVPKIIHKNKWRSINNTLHVDILDFTPKREYIATWRVLDNSEFVTLLGYIDTGFYSVVSNIPGHTFNLTLAWLELLDNIDHGFSGQRENIRVKISEK